MGNPWDDTVDKVKQSAVGNAVSGPAGAVAGAMSKGKGHGVVGDLVSGNIHGLSNDLGFTNDKGDQAWKDYKQSVEDQYGSTKDIIGKMEAGGQDYYKGVSEAGNAYKGSLDFQSGEYYKKLTEAKNQVQDQAQNSKATYTNTVLPKLQDLMEQSQKNAAGAMTLSQAQDPNNAVSSGVRDLYNKEGQNAQDVYGQQAGGIQKQGVADYGVLASLGSQATASQLGGVSPMTGGQMQAMQAANLGQAGSAFYNSQNAANAMRQQGTMANLGMRQQGIGAGIGQSNYMYGQGQQAHQQAGADVGQYAGANDRMNSLQNSYTMQGLGLSQDQFGTKMGQAQGDYNISSGLSGLKYGLGQQGLQNQLGASNMYYGAQQGVSSAEAAASNASQAGKLGAIGSVVGLAAGIGAGAMSGGAAGAGGAGAAGAGAAGAGGGGMSPYQTAQMGMQGAQMGGQIFQGAFGSPAPVAQPQQGYQPGMYGGYGGGQMYAGNPYQTR